MRKNISLFVIGGAKQIKSFSNSRLELIGLAIALTLGMANVKTSSADEARGEDREKITEMTALARHNERCLAAPREWAASYLILPTMTPPTGEQALAKEREMLALSGKFGNKKWCQLYSVEMEQAYIIYRLATQR